jgi:hypothetical protein
LSTYKTLLSGAMDCATSWVLSAVGMPVPLAMSGSEENLDGASLVRGTVCLGYVRQRQLQVEYLARADDSGQDIGQQGRQVGADRGDAAAEADIASGQAGGRMS